MVAPGPSDRHPRLFLALSRRPHTLEEAIYTGGLLVGAVVEWAKGLDPSSTLIHIDMREPTRVGAPQEGVNHGHMALAAAGPS